MSALFFLWYLTYVLLSAYARGFMSERLLGSVTVGLVFGLGAVRLDDRDHDRLRAVRA